MHSCNVLSGHGSTQHIHCCVKQAENNGGLPQHCVSRNLCTRLYFVLQAGKHDSFLFAGDTQLKTFLGKLDTDYAEHIQAWHVVDQACPERHHVLVHMQHNLCLPSCRNKAKRCAPNSAEKMVFSHSDMITAEPQAC